MDLIVCIGGEEKSWSHAKKLIEKGEWEQIVIVTNDVGSKKFSSSKKAAHIVLDAQKPAAELISYLSKELKSKIKSFEVGLNIVAGSGKEHMVILASLLKIGVGIRLIALTAEGVVEL